MLRPRILSSASHVRQDGTVTSEASNICKKEAKDGESEDPDCDIIEEVIKESSANLPMTIDVKRQNRIGRVDTEKLTKSMAPETQEAVVALCRNSCVSVELIRSGKSTRDTQRNKTSLQSNTADVELVPNPKYTKAAQSSQIEATKVIHLIGNPSAKVAPSRENISVNANIERSLQNSNTVEISNSPQPVKSTPINIHFALQSGGRMAVQNAPVSSTSSSKVTQLPSNLSDSSQNSASPFQKPAQPNSGSTVAQKSKIPSIRVAQLPKNSSPILQLFSPPPEKSTQFFNDQTASVASDSSTRIDEIVSSSTSEVTQLVPGSLSKSEPVLVPTTPHFIQNSSGEVIRLFATTSTNVSESLIVEDLPRTTQSTKFSTNLENIVPDPYTNTTQYSNEPLPRTEQLTVNDPTNEARVTPVNSTDTAQLIADLTTNVGHFGPNAFANPTQFLTNSSMKGGQLVVDNSTSAAQFVANLATTIGQYASNPFANTAQFVSSPSSRPDQFLPYITTNVSSTPLRLAHFVTNTNTIVGTTNLHNTSSLVMVLPVSNVPNQVFQKPTICTLERINPPPDLLVNALQSKNVLGNAQQSKTAMSNEQQNTLLSNIPQDKTDHTPQSNTLLSNLLQSKTLPSGTPPCNNPLSNVPQSNTMFGIEPQSKTLLSNAVQSNTLLSNLLQSNALLTNASQSNALLNDMLQSNTLLANTSQSNALLNDMLQSNTSQSNALLNDTLQSNTLLSNTSQSTTVLSNALQSNEQQRKTVLSYTPHNNTLHSNRPQSNTTQSNILQSNTTQSNILQSNTLHSNVLPSNTLHSNIMPSNTLPSNILQSKTLPSNTLHSNVLQSNTLHSNALPGNTPHSNIMPSNTRPSNILQSNTLPSNILQSNTLPSNALHSNVLPSNTPHSNIMPSNTLPSNILQSNTLPSNTLHSNVLHSNVLPSNILQSNTLPSNILHSNILPSNTQQNNTLPNYKLQSNTLVSNRPQINTLPSNILPSNSPQSNTLSSYMQQNETLLSNRPQNETQLGNTLQKTLLGNTSQSQNPQRKIPQIDTSQIDPSSSNVMETVVPIPASILKQRDEARRLSEMRKKIFQKMLDHSRDQSRAKEPEIRHVPWSDDKSQEENFFAESQKTLIPKETTVDPFGIAKRALSLAKKAAVKGPQARVKLVDVRKMIKGSLKVKSKSTRAENSTNNDEREEVSQVEAKINRRNRIMNAMKIKNERLHPNGMPPKMTALERIQARLTNALSRISKKRRSTWRATCPVCGDKFNDKYAFHRHLRVSHPGKNIVFCGLCTCSFLTDEELSKHRLSYHRITVVKDADGKVTVIEPPEKSQEPEEKKTYIKIENEFDMEFLPPRARARRFFRRRSNRKRLSIENRAAFDPIPGISRARDNFRARTMQRKRKKKIIANVESSEKANSSKSGPSTNVEKNRKPQTKNKTKTSTYNYVDAEVVKHGAIASKTKFKSAEIRKLIVPITRLEGPLFEKYMKKFATSPVVGFGVNALENDQQILDKNNLLTPRRTKKINETRCNAKKEKSPKKLAKKKTVETKKPTKGQKTKENLTISRDSMSADSDVGNREPMTFVALKNSPSKREKKIKSIYSESDDDDYNSDPRLIVHFEDDEDLTTREEDSVDGIVLGELLTEIPFDRNITSIEMDASAGVAEIVKERQVIRKLISRSSVATRTTMDNKREKKDSQVGKIRIEDADTESSQSSVRKTIHDSSSDDDSTSERIELKKPLPRKSKRLRKNNKTLPKRITFEDSLPLRSTRSKLSKEKSLSVDEKCTQSNSKSSAEEKSFSEEETFAEAFNRELRRLKALSDEKLLKDGAKSTIVLTQESECLKLTTNEKKLSVEPAENAESLLLKSLELLKKEENNRAETSASKGEKFAESLIQESRGSELSINKENLANDGEKSTESLPRESKRLELSGSEEKSQNEDHNSEELPTQESKSLELSSNEEKSPNEDHNSEELPTQESKSLELSGNEEKSPNKDHNSEELPTQESKSLELSSNEEKSPNKGHNSEELLTQESKSSESSSNEEKSPNEDHNSEELPTQESKSLESSSTEEKSLNADHKSEELPTLESKSLESSSTEEKSLNADHNFEELPTLESKSLESSSTEEKSSNEVHNSEELPTQESKSLEPSSTEEKSQNKDHNSEEVPSQESKSLESSSNEKKSENKDHNSEEVPIQESKSSELSSNDEKSPNEDEKTEKWATQESSSLALSSNEEKSLDEAKKLEEPLPRVPKSSKSSSNEEKSLSEAEKSAESSPPELKSSKPSNVDDKSSEVNAEFIDALHSETENSKSSTVEKMSLSEEDMMEKPVDLKSDENSLDEYEKLEKVLRLESEGSKPSSNDEKSLDVPTEMEDSSPLKSNFSISSTNDEKSSEELKPVEETESFGEPVERMKNCSESSESEENPPSKNTRSNDQLLGSKSSKQSSNDEKASSKNCTSEQSLPPQSKDSNSSSDDEGSTIESTESKGGQKSTSNAENCPLGERLRFRRTLRSTGLSSSNSKVSAPSKSIKSKKSQTPKSKRSQSSICKKGSLRRRAKRRASRYSLRRKIARREITKKSRKSSDEEVTKLSEADTDTPTEDTEAEEKISTDEKTTEKVDDENEPAEEEIDVEDTEKKDTKRPRGRPRKSETSEKRSKMKKKRGRPPKRRKIREESEKGKKRSAKKNPEKCSTNNKNNVKEIKPRKKRGKYKKKGVVQEPIKPDDTPVETVKPVKPLRTYPCSKKRAEKIRKLLEMSLKFKNEMSKKLCSNCEALASLMKKITHQLAEKNNDDFVIKCPFCDRYFVSLFHVDLHVSSNHMRCPNEIPCKRPEALKLSESSGNGTVPETMMKFNDGTVLEDEARAKNNVASFKKTSVSESANCTGESSDELSKKKGDLYRASINVNRINDNFSSCVDKNSTRPTTLSTLDCIHCDAKFFRSVEYIRHIRNNHDATSNANDNEETIRTGVRRVTPGKSLLRKNNPIMVSIEKPVDNVPTPVLNSSDQLIADRKYLLKQLMSDDSSNDLDDTEIALTPEETVEPTLDEKLVTDSSSDEGSSQVIDIPVNRHTCNVCQKTFVRAQDLLAHGLGHVGSEPEDTNRRIPENKRRKTPTYRQGLFVDLESEDDENFEDFGSAESRRIIPINDSSDDEGATNNIKIGIKRKAHWPISGSRKVARIDPEMLKSRQRRIFMSKKARSGKRPSPEPEATNDSFEELLDNDQDLGNDDDAINNKKLSIACGKCNRHFANRSLLNEHLFFLHDDSLKDTVLTDILTPIGSLQNDDENQPKSWRCETCAQNFKLLRGYSRHRYFVHGDDSSVHVCENCSKVLTTITEVNVHICTDVASYNCRTCNETFATGMSLRLHNTEKHMEMIGVNYCETCDKEFLTSAMLKRHKKFKHRFFRPYRARKTSPVHMAAPSNDDSEQTERFTGNNESENDWGRIDNGKMRNQRGRPRSFKIKKIIGQTIVNRIVTSQFAIRGKRKRGRPRKYPRSDDEEPIPPKTKFSLADLQIDVAPETTVYIDENEVHQCSVCQLYCISISALANHMTQIHSMEDEICQLCQEIYPNGKILRHMMDNHVSSDDNSDVNGLERSWKIGINCNELDAETVVRTLGINRLVSLWEYRRYSGKKKQSYDCTECEKTFPSNELYRYHYLLHHDAMCVICNIEYKTGHDAARHKIEIHGSVGRYIWFADRTIVALSSARNFARLAEESFIEMITREEISDDVNAEGNDSAREEMNVEMENLDCMEVSVYSDTINDVRTIETTKINTGDSNDLESISMSNEQEKMLVVVPTILDERGITLLDDANLSNGHFTAIINNNERISIDNGNLSEEYTAVIANEDEKILNALSPEENARTMEEVKKEESVSVTTNHEKPGVTSLEEIVAMITDEEETVVEASSSLEENIGSRKIEEVCSVMNVDSSEDKTMTCLEESRINRGVTSLEEIVAMIAHEEEIPMEDNETIAANEGETRLIENENFTVEKDGTLRSEENTTQVARSLEEIIDTINNEEGKPFVEAISENAFTSREEVVENANVTTEDVSSMTSLREEMEIVDNEAQEEVAKDSPDENNTAAMNNEEASLRGVKTSLEEIITMIENEEETSPVENPISSEENAEKTRTAVVMTSSEENSTNDDEREAEKDATSSNEHVSSIVVEEEETDLEADAAPSETVSTMMDQNETGDDYSVDCDDFAEPDEVNVVIVVTDDDLDKFNIASRYPNIWGLAAKISSTVDYLTPTEIKEILANYFERPEDFETQTDGS